MTPISSIAAPIVPPGVGQLALPPAGASDEVPFRNLLLAGLDQVNSMQQEASAAVEQLVTGGEVNPAEVLTALQKAEMSFKLMLQIRNKLVEAYQEVNNIRI